VPAKDPPDESRAEPLKRLGGGRWQTRDGRFTIEPGDGRWSVVDAEQTDELGLQRVRGPFGSLTDAKAAIAQVRDQPAPTSPLEAPAGRTAAPSPDRDGGDAKKQPPADERRGRASKKVAVDAADAQRPHAEATPSETPPEPSKPEPPPRERPQAEPPEEPSEPAWLRRLDDTRADRARRLIRDLERAGFDGAERIAREDVVEDRPAVAKALLLRSMARALAAAPHLDAIEAAGLALDVLTRGSDADVPARLPGWTVMERRPGADDRELTVRKGDLRRAVEDETAG